MRNLYKLVNAETPFPNQKCVKAHPEDPWKCFMSPNLVQFIDTPTFLIESQYDTWSIENVVGQKCITIMNTTLDGCSRDERETVHAARD